MKKYTRLYIIILVVILVVWAGAVISMTPPKALPKDAPDTVFSAERAVEYLSKIAEAPHPTGSDEHEEVRNYIMNTIKEMGIEPEIQQTEVFYGGKFSRVYNIIARINGNGQGKAVLTDVHYDSVPTGPGASDNGVAVASALEVMRILKSETAVHINDIIFLFSDNEEVGLSGTIGFMQEHPYKDEVGFVLNFDARGTDGPVLFYETTPGNYETVKTFASLNTGTPGNSMLVEAYQRMGNGSDYTVYKTLGIQGVNFAFIGTPHRYHTTMDSVENVNMRTFQQVGDLMLKGIKGYWDKDLLALLQNKDAVFFSLPGLGMVVYPGWFSWLTIAIGILLGLVGIFLGLYNRLIQLGKLFLSLVSMLVLLAITYFLYPVLQNALQYILPNLHVKVYGAAYFSDPLFWAFTLLSMAVWFCIFSLLEKKLGRENILLANLMLWLILTVGVAFYVPGAVFLVVWPLIFESIAIILFLGKEKENTGFFSIIPFLIASLLWVPLIISLCQAFTLAQFRIAAVTLLLISGFMLPRLVNRFQNFHVVPLVIFLIVIALFVVEGQTSDVAVDLTSKQLYQKNETTVFYVKSFNDAGDLYYWDPLGKHAEIFRSPENEVMFDPEISEITVLKDNKTDSGRELMLHVQPIRKDTRMYLQIENPENIESVLFNEKHFVESKYFTMHVISIPPEGYTLSIKSKGTGAITLFHSETHYTEDLIMGTELETTFNELTEGISDPVIFGIHMERKLDF